MKLVWNKSMGCGLDEDIVGLAVESFPTPKILAKSNPKIMGHNRCLHTINMVQICVHLILMSI